MANQIRGRCGFSVAKAGLHSRPYFLRRCWRCSLPSRTVRARLRILNWISYESRNVTINVPTAARAARASKTFDISDTSKGKHRPRAGIRRCDSTARDSGALALGGGLPDTEAIPHGITALPGMCAMTQTAPRSCWRRGRASTTGCPTVVRTMGVRGGKRKNGEGQNPSPFR